MAFSGKVGKAAVSLGASVLANAFIKRISKEASEKIIKKGAESASDKVVEKKKIYSLLQIISKISTTI